MSFTRPLDFSLCAYVLQLFAALLIVSFAGAAWLSLGWGRGISRARLLVAQGVVGGLSLMTAATLLRTIELRTWRQIFAFTSILTLRIVLKKLFGWEKGRLLLAPRASIA